MILLILVGCVIAMWLVSALCGCSDHEAKDYPVSLQDIEKKAGFYAETIQKDPEAIIDARCDGLTWRALGHYVEIPYPIFDMEYNDGEWHRDYKLCYPDDSRSEISRDGLIMLLLTLLDHKDLDSVLRLNGYGVAHAWVMGEGPKKYTSGRLLSPIIDEIIEHLSGKKLAAESSDSVLKMDTFRGNLLAMYVWTRAIMRGKLNELEWQTVRNLYFENKENPLYSALYHKFYGEGDQSHTLDLLGRQGSFPADSLPGRVELFNWGDAPGSILFLVAVKIVKHKYK